MRSEVSENDLHRLDMHSVTVPIIFDKSSAHLFPRFASSFGAYSRSSGLESKELGNVNPLENELGCMAVRFAKLETLRNFHHVIDGGDRVQA